MIKTGVRIVVDVKHDLIAWKNREGLVGPNLWVAFHDGCYMYGGETIEELLEDIQNNWQSDNAIVG